MALLTPAALLGLLLLPLLVLLHLRRPQQRTIEVSSTLLWQDLLPDGRGAHTLLHLLSLLPLVLQLLAVALLVLALGQPGVPSSAAPAPPQHIYIVDDSLRMTATDLQPTRLAAAIALVGRELGHAARGEAITIIAAGSQPTVLVTDVGPAQARRALSALAPQGGSADLGAALRLADSLATSTSPPQERITLLYARGDTLPTVYDRRHLLERVALGRSSDDQAILRFSARCGPLPGSACTAYAVVHNDADRAINDSLAILGGGDLLAVQPLTLPPHRDSGVAFRIPRNQHTLELHLTRPDLIALDNSAWCVVQAPQRTQVTVVSDDPAHLNQFAQTLGALPDTTVRSVTPSHLDAALAATSDLLILDRWDARASLPAAPAVLLIAPTTLPGGQVGSALDSSLVSGLDSTNLLLDGADLTSLDVPAGTAEGLTLPPPLAPIVWSAASPLLAAGVQGGQRLAVLAFEPGLTNLPQLSAYPIVLSNLLRWAQGWLPTAATVGHALLIPHLPGTTQVEVTAADQVTAPSGTIGQSMAFTATAPGLYTVVERGPFATRSGQIAVNSTDNQPGDATPMTLEAAARAATIANGRTTVDLWVYAVLAAAMAIGGEWIYALRR